jgi:hypothetical protein
MRQGSSTAGGGSKYFWYFCRSFFAVNPALGYWACDRADMITLNADDLRWSQLKEILFQIEKLFGKCSLVSLAA